MSDYAEIDPNTGEVVDNLKSKASYLEHRLKAFHNSKAEKPKIRYFEGIDGLRKMQKEYEMLDGDIIQIVGYDTFLMLHDPLVTIGHQTEILKKKKRVKSILITDKKVSIPESNVEFRTISPSIFDVQGEMAVCGDRLALFSYTSGIIAIEIRSKAIADTARATLELAWRSIPS